MTFITKKAISIKNTKTITEAHICDYLGEHPEYLGFGELELIEKERPTLTGRIDLLLGDGDSQRFIVEAQLGQLDPSHIIRAIEYWNHQRNTYPQYSYTVVIIAEDFSRYLDVLNVLSNIPFVAIKASLYEGNQLQFDKVFERVVAIDDEIIDQETYDREFWVKKSDSKSFAAAEKMIAEIILPVNRELTLAYMKNYLGIKVLNGRLSFLKIKLTKKSIYIDIKRGLDEKLEELVDKANITIDYRTRRGGEYRLTFDLEKLSQEQHDGLQEIVKHVTEQ